MNKLLYYIYINFLLLRRKTKFEYWQIKELDYYTEKLSNISRALSHLNETSEHSAMAYMSGCYTMFMKLLEVNRYRKSIL